MNAKLADDDKTNLIVFFGTFNIASHSLYKKVQLLIPKNWKVAKAVDSMSMAFNSKTGEVIEKSYPRSVEFS